jgi:hypothetical protein
MHVYVIAGAPDMPDLPDDLIAQLEKIREDLDALVRARERVSQPSATVHAWTYSLAVPGGPIPSSPAVQHILCHLYLLVVHFCILP